MGSESAPSSIRSQASASSRNGDNGAVPVLRRSYETQVQQIKDPPVRWYKKKKQFFLCLAKLHGLFGIITDGVDVPVADETISIVALQEAFPHENVQKDFIAWNILLRAIANKGDRDTLRHASSPAAGWRALVDTYSAYMLRKASEARVNRRRRRYYLVILLPPNTSTLACPPLSSI